MEDVGDVADQIITGIYAAGDTEEDDSNKIHVFKLVRLTRVDTVIAVANV